MKFDVSQANLYLFCPAAWWERYINRLEIDTSKQSWTSALVFGTRFHKLLHAYYLSQPVPEPTEEEQVIEDECQVMFARYKATYPEEDFTVVDWEKYFEVPIGIHTLCGQIDGVVQMKDTGRYKILDTKTEKRGSKANSNERWATLDQGSIYMYAGSQLFGEQFDGIILNICTKASPKGQVGEDFRRLRLERTQEQIDRAVADMLRVAEHMELSMQIGPHEHREECISKMTGWKCDYYPLHVIGRSPETLGRFRESRSYLNEQ